MNLSPASARTLLHSPTPRGISRRDKILDSRRALYSWPHIPVLHAQKENNSVVWNQYLTSPRLHHHFVSGGILIHISVLEPEENIRWPQTLAQVVRIHIQHWGGSGCVSETSTLDRPPGRYCRYPRTRRRRCCLDALTCLWSLSSMSPMLKTTPCTDLRVQTHICVALVTSILRTNCKVRLHSDEWTHTIVSYLINVDGLEKTGKWTKRQNVDRNTSRNTSDIT